MYIRKNHLTVGEDPEIYEIVSADGKTVHWHGTDDELSHLLDDDEWHLDSVVALDESWGGEPYARLVGPDVL